MRISDWSSDVCSSDLVHAMLDERIARERADDIQARHAGLEGRRQLGKGLAVGAGEFDAHRLDKGTRRHRPQPRDDGVASYALIADGGFQRQPALLDPRGLRLGARLVSAILARPRT